jgi:hypothetical protein
MSAVSPRAFDVYCSKSGGRETLFATYSSVAEAQAVALRLSSLGCRSRVSPAPGGSGMSVAGAPSSEALSSTARRA